MKTSRQRVLDYIRLHRAVTTAELCQALHSTEANMRRHLAILQEEGLVRVIGTRREAPGPAAPAAPGRRGRAPRGRPARIFGPAEPSPTEQLERLSAALLEETLAGAPPEAQRAFLERVAERLAAEPAAAPPHGRQARPDSLTTRLFTAVERLNRAHYQARWEARPDGPRVTLGRCPFGDLPARRPEICQVDAHLLELLIGAPLTQVKRLEKDARGLPYCLFRLL